jgi:hypothetical protein
VTLTYVYCLVRSPRRPALRGVPEGVVAGAAPRALDAGGGLWAIVATVPAREFDEPALAAGLSDLEWVGRRAMAHEAVVEHFLPAPAVLPMQLFTLFTSDARALEHIAGDRPRIERILASVERQLEWGLRLTLDVKAVPPGNVPVREGSGSAYLLRKRDQLELARARLADARAKADSLYEALAGEATDARRRTATEQAAPGARLLLDAAFLVPIRRSGAFRMAVRRGARALGTSGIVVSLTGPWPAYNFIADAVSPAPAPARRRTKRAAARPAGAASKTARRRR